MRAETIRVVVVIEPVNSEEAILSSTVEGKAAYAAQIRAAARIARVVNLEIDKIVEETKWIDACIKPIESEADNA